MRRRSSCDGGADEHRRRTGQPGQRGVLGEPAVEVRPQDHDDARVAAWVDEEVGDRRALLDRDLVGPRALGLVDDEQVRVVRQRLS